MKKIPFTLISGLALLSAIILFGYLGPIFVDISNYEVASVMPSQPPSSELIFGSDSQGRDMLSVTIYSIPQTIKIAIIAGSGNFPIQIATENKEGKLVDLVIGAVADREEGGGSLLIVSPSLVPDSNCDQSLCDLSSIYDEGGLGSLTTALVNLFNVGFTEEVL